MMTINKAKELRKGYTTGSCAAAAATVAARLLITPELAEPEIVNISLPSGDKLGIPVNSVERGDWWVSCAVRKDSGDDPDVTNGALVFAKVSKLGDRPGEIVLRGGQGIGVVTKPGLACSVGEHAINPVPKQMIRAHVGSETDAAGYGGGLLVEISIPAGVELAKRTFNPKLGIEGGISVLGTTGIVEPMSEKAIIDTIKVEINMKKAVGMSALILTPGNYGQAFLKEYLGDAKEHVIKCSNFIGDSAEYCSKSGFSGIVLAGHIGKIVKVAAGAMNTHSKYGDARMETIVAYAKQIGAKDTVARKLAECVTTEEAVALMKEYKILYPIVDLILKDTVSNLKNAIGRDFNIEVILYANMHGFLGETGGAGELIKMIMEETNG